MSKVATVHDKSKDELLDILEEKKQKQKGKNQKKYVKSKGQRHEDYIKNKQLVDCECGKKVLKTSLKKHQLSRQHAHDVKELARKKDIFETEQVPEITAEEKKQIELEALDANLTETSDTVKETKKLTTDQLMVIEHSKENHDLKTCDLPNFPCGCLDVSKKMYTCERCNYHTLNKQEYGHHHNTTQHKSSKYLF
jgi:hypothetical protein